MTVSDLINLLKKENPNATIIISTSNSLTHNEDWFKVDNLKGSNAFYVYLNCYEEWDSDTK